MAKQLSVAEIKAVAEAAITTRQAADAAKKAAEDAGGSDEALNAAAESAEKAALDAKAAADALSQEPQTDDKAKKIRKMQHKKRIIERDLKELGVDDDEDDEEDDDEDDEEELDKPLTRRDLRKIEADRTFKTAVSMAEAIDDAGDKAAVQAALKSIVPSGDANEDFRKAVAIANIDRNSKILEEVGRKTPARSTPTKTGGAPLRTEEFVPTAEEAQYMRAPFNLSKADIIKARKA